MQSSSPSPPPSPNPYSVSAAQTTSDVTTGIANAILANADDDNPYATVNFGIVSNIDLTDPQYDTAGTHVGDTTRTISVFKRTVTLKTNAQTIFTQQQTLQQDMNTFAIAQVGTLTSTLSSAFTLSGLPATASGPNPPTLNSSVSSTGPRVSSVGASDYRRDVDEVLAALKDRLEWQLEQDRAALVERLSNQGIFPGTEAWNREMRGYSFTVNDARTKAILASRQEHSRLFGIELQAASFQNEAQEGQFRQNMTLITFANDVSIKSYQLQSELADYVNSLRDRALREQLAARNQPLNELSTLIHGGQQQLPDFVPYRPSRVSDTNVSSNVYGSAGIDQSNYQFKYTQRLQQQQAMIGGIAAIAGGILLAPMTGGASLVGAAISGIGTGLQQANNSGFGP